MRFLLLFLLVITVPFVSKAQVVPSYDLPLLSLETEGRAIPDRKKITGRMTITERPAEEGAADKILYDGYAGIELRGSSSKRFPKKGYGLETRNQDGSDRQTPLLGLPREEDWVLHGPYSDKSLIRNALAYTLSAELAVSAPRVRMVEVELNGDYRGVYLLTESVKRDRNRVPVSKVGDDATADDLSGGYILKIDKMTGEKNKSTAAFTSRYVDRVNGNPPPYFIYHYPAPEDITPEQKGYISGWMHAFESVLEGEDFADPAAGYRKYIDVRSFIDYLLINELSRNVDGLRLSTYMYKERDSKGGKLHMGPVWDYNLAFGNADYCRSDQPEGWAYVNGNVCGGKNWPIPFWWRRLMEDDAFRTQLHQRWQALRAGSFSDAALAGTVDRLVAEMGDAPRRNFTRFPVIGEKVWPNAFVGESYAAEIDYLKTFLTRRAAWMDGELNRLAR